MGMTGDFDKLAKLRFQIGRAPAGIMHDATDAAKTVVSEQYQADFTGSHSPWGETWPSRKAGGGAPLQGPTGALQGATPTASGGVVRLRPPRYWVFHQIGANNMHQRQVLPFGPSQWDAPIQRRVDQVVTDHFSGTGED